MTSSAHENPAAVPSALIGAFAANPGGMGKAMRDALASDPRGFADGVLRDGVRGASDRGFRYALILLHNGGLLIPALASPATTSQSQALRITQVMLDIEKNFANAALEATLEVPGLRKPACQLRILEVIAGLLAAQSGQVTNWRNVTRLYEQGVPA